MYEKKNKDEKEEDGVNNNMVSVSSNISKKINYWVQKILTWKTDAPILKRKTTYGDHKIYGRR
jgi:hypothetical protein